MICQPTKKAAAYDLFAICRWSQALRTPLCASDTFRVARHSMGESAWCARTHAGLGCAYALCAIGPG